MPRKKIACASCGLPMQPGPRSLPEGVAAHKTCPVGDRVIPRPASPVEFAPSAPDEMVSRRAELEWMRSVLRESIRDAEAAKRAPLVAQLRAVVDELGALTPPGEVSSGNVSDIRSLIAARLADASGAGNAGSAGHAR